MHEIFEITKLIEKSFLDPLLTGTELTQMSQTTIC